MRVIFVCSGNTCRSPFAEGYFNNLKLKGISAESRGLTAPGMPVSEYSAAIASKYGFDISDHRSTVFNRDDLDADYIFTMSDDIKDLLISFGAAKDKTFTLGNGISDPYGGDITVYGKALRKIADEIDKLVFGGFFDKIRIVEMKKEHIPFIVKTEEDNFSKPWSERSII
ncbi:MAG: hypothetical protein J5766_01835, partial [Clostridia bacterium]|nr:hypothetical protein [Clostridia bacterium]